MLKFESIWDRQKFSDYSESDKWVRDYLENRVPKGAFGTQARIVTEISKFYGEIWTTLEISYLISRKN